ncbi:MAG: RluA family pseudouridine synthase, partial [Andreesenia angusta]|nr:RluA family pseudouridine synthase [Andreesenia angusta]
MQEIKIGSNEMGQRADRFLKKYLAKASSGFIYKMIRKKNIKLNNKRMKPEEILKNGDIIQLYLSDKTIAKFIEDEEIIEKTNDLNIVYEDDNILIINKDIGVLSHSTKGNYSEKDIVSNMISYLYKKGEYNPRIEKTFSPAICNRLDRNTSGLLIAAKNYNSLKKINYAIKNREIEKYYKTIVLGSVDKDISLRGYLLKDENRNKAFITEQKVEDSKEIITDIKVLRKNQKYSLIEINLITG